MTRRLHVVLALATLSALGWQLSTHSQTPRFDLVIRGGHVVDGTGSPWFAADVAISGDTIVAVSPRLDATGARVLDATGLVVAPGFVDVHSHSEVHDDGQDIIGNPGAENNVRQGVTTVFASPDGGGSVRVADYLARVGAARPAINVGSFVGHGSVRSAVIGQADRPATAEEMQRMKELVRAGMREGAFGLSTGLFYVPGSYAPLQEVIDLAAVAGEFGGIHQSHMRDETGKVLDSVRDTIAIGEQGHLPTQVTHHKIIGKSNWGRSADTLRLIDEARARGVDVTIDQYPYTASSTSIQGGLLPTWVQEGGREKMLERLRDEPSLRRTLTAITSSIENDRGGGDPANIVLAACPFDPSLAGKNLSQVLRDRKRPATADQAADLVIEIVQRGGCSAVYHAISEDDLVRIMKHPATMIASDASPGIPTFGKDVPHPRAYGTFARVLGLYVREKKVLSLEEAVRKMSSYPARRMGLADRGILRPGMKADVVVFDAATVIDKATFEKPHQYAAGVADVIVNGRPTLVDGTVTGERGGRTLKGGGS
ncbi:MAG TPA: D-aminoacylase [Vicinamibacterales bacterium]|nr:D-aminoacylase [Vicinamibacterales bacterium]